LSEWRGGKPTAWLAGDEKAGAMCRSET
jgi:hypothetical protein